MEVFPASASGIPSTEDACVGVDVGDDGCDDVGPSGVLVVVVGGCCDVDVASSPEDWPGVTISSCSTSTPTSLVCRSPTDSFGS